MKKLIWVLAILISGCKTPQIYWETLDVSRNESNTEVKISYPYRFGGIDTSTIKINNAIENFIKEGLVENCPDCSIDSSVTVMLTEKSSDSIVANMQYAFYTSGSVYVKGDTTSVNILRSYFTGGANFNNQEIYMNFNTKTGDVIPCDKIVSSMDIAMKMVSDSLQARYPSKDGYSLFFANVDVKNPPIPTNIGIDSTGYIFCYNQYEIAPRSTGIIKITIPFNEVKSLF